MPKLLANSRNNYNTTAGILEDVNTKINQSVLTDSDVSFNSIEIANDAIINGDLKVYGEASIFYSSITEFSDNILLINSEETSPGVSLNLAGIEIDRGSSTNFQAVFEESSDSFKIGFIGDLQSIATRENSPLNNGVMVYNGPLNRLDSVNSISIPITFSSGVLSSNSSTGSLIVSGGVGISQDIHLDKRIYIKGSTYDNYISSDIINNLNINSANNIIFSTFPSGRIRIPTNTLLTFSSDSQNISSNGGTLTLTCSTGDINLSSSNDIKLNNNSSLKWDSNNRVVYESLSGNLNLYSSGEINLNSITNVLNSTSSSSSSTGSFKTSGGIGISNTTDAASITNGGTLTSSGGGSFAKSLFLGNTLNVCNGTDNIGRIHLSLKSSSNNTRFNIGLINDDLGSNIGSDFRLWRYDDSGTFIGSVLGVKRSSGDITLFSETSSTSSLTGSLVCQGGISISNSTNSSSFSNGGTLTTAGGMGIAKDLHVGGSITASSDRRLKRNIEKVEEDYIDLVKRIECVKYRKIFNDRQEIGIIAQELKEIIPELVLGSEEEYYSIDYQKLSVVLLKSVQRIIQVLEL